MFRRLLLGCTLLVVAACSLLEEEETWATIESGISSTGFVNGEGSYFACAEIEGYDGELGLTLDLPTSKDYVWAGQRCAEFGYQRDGGLGEGDRRYLGPNGGTQRASAGYFVNGGGGGGGDGNVICPNVSSPYRCLTNANGQQIPTVYNRPELHGTWVDEGIDLCITWNADGTSKGRNRGGFGGGPRDFPGQWGVIVNAKGDFQPTANQWYVFTTGLDAQTTLLTFDKTVDPTSQPTRQIVGWAFRKTSDNRCPW